MYDDNIMSKIKSVLASRYFYICLAFLSLSIILIVRAYELQIINKSQDNISDQYLSRIERYIPATRGRIYDCEGRLLADNMLCYSVYIEQSASLVSNQDRNNTILKLTRILREHGYKPELSFDIEINEDGELAFTVSGNAELRFKKNAYGLKSVNNLSEKQRNATAAELFDWMCHGDRTAAMFQIADDLSLQEQLDICSVRYHYFASPNNSEKYTMATNIDSETVAAILENAGELPGVSVEQQPKRVYYYSEYFAHVIGYTGLINEAELEELNNQGNGTYTTTDHVGKTGIESIYEDVLAGTKGVERVTLNSAGKVVSREVVSEPVPGNNVYLTLNAELTMDYYYDLEKSIASVLSKNIVNDMDYGTKGISHDNIKVPIYEVYNAFFENHIFDMAHITSDEGTENERAVFRLFLSYKENILNVLRDYLAYGNRELSSNLSESEQDFLAYLYQTMRTSGYIDPDKIDTQDPFYIAYDYDSISFNEYLEHCIVSEWVDLEALGINGEFLTSAEIYDKLISLSIDTMVETERFDLMMYRFLIFTYKLSGRQICLLLFDQNVLEYNEEEYKKISLGQLEPYDFILEKIKDLDITPAQLALEPYSGAVVHTDCNTGNVLAIVNYPSYDNNRLANRIDWDYYEKLLNDISNPLYNRATQMRTPTGSTIKPMTGVAGLLNNVITADELIYDEVTFTKIDPSPSCWSAKGHGWQNLAVALKNSCNFYFCEVGYRLASNNNTEKYSDTVGISKLLEIGTIFGFTEHTGIELAEADPSFADTDAVRASIGYGHNFTLTQLNRYANTLATRGKVLEFTILQKITDKDGVILFEQTPSVARVIEDIPQVAWDSIKQGMEDVIATNSTLSKAYSTVPATVACKTGTAVVSDYNAPHALTISFAPSDNPTSSISAIIPNGYSGTYAAILLSDIYKSFYDIVDTTELGEIEYVHD